MVQKEQFWQLQRNATKELEKKLATEIMRPPPSVLVLLLVKPQTETDTQTSWQHSLTIGGHLRLLSNFKSLRQVYHIFPGFLVFPFFEHSFEDRVKRKIKT